MKASVAIKSEKFTNLSCLMLVNKFDKKLSACQIRPMQKLKTKLYFLKKYAEQAS